MKVLWVIALLCVLVGIGVFCYSIDQMNEYNWHKNINLVTDNQQHIYTSLEGLALAVFPICLVLCITKLAERKPE